MIERIALSDIKRHEKATVVDILGGMGLKDRLRSMGIRIGVKVQRVNSPFGSRGPVVIKVGQSQTALGHGMSYKIVVEVER